MTSIPDKFKFINKYLPKDNPLEYVATKRHNATTGISEYVIDCNCITPFPFKPYCHSQEKVESFLSSGMWEIIVNNATNEITDFIFKCCDDTCQRSYVLLKDHVFVVYHTELLAEGKEVKTEEELRTLLTAIVVLDQAMKYNDQMDY